LAQNENYADALIVLAWKVHLKSGVKLRK